MVANATLHIRHLQQDDIPPVTRAFAKLGWNKPASQYQRYLAEQEHGQRAVLVALIDDRFAGYVTVQWESGYPPFEAARIPEIVDLNVLPHFRRQGIAASLLDQAETLIGRESDIAGIGVGMTADYGAAQRIYVKRGYIPDGRGLTCNNQPLSYGAKITVDDELVLYFTKHLNR